MRERSYHNVFRKLSPACDAMHAPHMTYDRYAITEGRNSINFSVILEGVGDASFLTVGPRHYANNISSLENAMIRLSKH